MPKGDLWFYRMAERMKIGSQCVACGKPGVDLCLSSQPDHLVIYQSTLIGRGWSRPAIQRLLGDPDVVRTNYHHRTSAPTRLYLLSRVEAVEAGDGWRKRVVRRKTAAEKRREAYDRQIKALVVPVNPARRVVRTKD